MGRAGPVLLALLLAVAGCGDDGDGGDGIGGVNGVGDAAAEPSGTADTAEQGAPADGGPVEDGLFTGKEGAIELEVRGGEVVRFSAPIVVPCGGSGIRNDVVVVEEPIPVEDDGSFDYDTPNLKVSGLIAGDDAEGLMSLNRGDYVNTATGIAFCIASDAPWAASR